MPFESSLWRRPTTAAIVLSLALLAATLGCSGNPPPPNEPTPEGPPAVPAATLEPVPTDPAPQASNGPTTPPANLAPNAGGDPYGVPGANPPSSELPPAELPAAPSATNEGGHVAPPAGQRRPMFVDWQQPDFVLIASGRQNGYIEPCGCAGLTNQKGGLARRWTFLRELAAKGWNPVPVDVGNQVRRFGRQPEIKFQRTAAALKRMGYAAIAYGPDDARLSAVELFSAATGDDAEPLPFLGANVDVLGETPTHRVVTAGGKRIGVTAILGDAEQRRVNNQEIGLRPAAEALAEAAAKLREERCDLYVLLAHASLDETIRLAQKEPLFQVVVTAGGAEEPPLELEKIPGTGATLVQIGGKGMFVSAVGVYLAGEPQFRYERVPLDDRYADAPEMLRLLADYQQELEGVGLEGLGVRPIPHPSGRTFVGSQKCADCHSTAYDIWKDTPHAHALESLIHPGERIEIPRHFDPECLSCHVTGWDPQGFFPFESGYLDVKKSPLLHGSGCENCHGPGSAHVAAENGEGDDALRRRLRDEMRSPLAGGVAEKKCLECHDLDNSPDFHKPGAFERYWKQIEHIGKD